MQRCKRLVYCAFALALLACGDADAGDGGGDGGADADAATPRDAASGADGSVDGGEAPHEDAGAPRIAMPSDFVGDWEGSVPISLGRELTVVMRITYEQTAGFDVILDSPDQGAWGIPGEDAIIAGERFLVTFPLIGGAMDLTREGEDLVGLFTQGASLPIRLSPTVIPPFPRPQEENLQRDYPVRDVSFPGGAEGLTLAGELTLPAEGGPFPAVVLVAGTEAEDRDLLLIDHRPHLILSDRLTRAGIATLRYDNRGRGESGGELEGATTEDLAADAAAAFAFLQGQADVDAARVGFVGHMEGSIATLISGAEPAFSVLLASPTQPIAEVLMRRSREIGLQMGTPEDVLASQRMLQEAIFETVSTAESPEQAHSEVVQLLVNAGLRIEQAIAEADGLTRPWLLWLLAYDPLPPLRELSTPALALYGTKDLIVAADANAPDMELALMHADSRVEVLEDLNHFFMPAEYGGPGEYPHIEISFDEGAMQTIADFITDVAAP